MCPLPRTHVIIYILFYCILDMFSAFSGVRCSRHVITFFRLMHHLAHDWAMTLDIYPDFILLHCATFIRLGIRACIIISIILLYISVFGLGARNRSILFILHHVYGLRTRSGSSSFCLAFICLLDWDAVP